MATKTIKAWINGVVQEIEVEDIPYEPEVQDSTLEERLISLEADFAESEVTTDNRLDALEDKPIVTAGNFLIGDGTENPVEITPADALHHINGVSVETVTSAEYEALETSQENTLYMISDAEADYYTKTETDEKVSSSELITVEDIDSICSSTASTE